MNFRTLVHTIDRYCNNGEFGMARKLIEQNVDRLSTPEKRKHLSSDASDLLKIVISANSQEQADEPNGSMKRTMRSNPLLSRKKKEDALRQEAKIQMTIQKVNEYCKDFNWRRAKNTLEENLDLFLTDTHRTKLNSEARALLETIEVVSKESKVHS